MVAFGDASVTRSGLPTGLDASGRIGRGTGASTAAWISFGMAFRGSLGSLASSVFRLWFTHCLVFLLQVDHDLQPFGLQASCGSLWAYACILSLNQLGLCVGHRA